MTRRGLDDLRIPVQDDGTGGPRIMALHQRVLPRRLPTHRRRPHRHYLTTNEYAVFGPGFFGAQVYGMGNNVLTGGTGSVVLFDTLGAGPDGAGFTVWAAQTPGNQFDTSNGGSSSSFSSRAVFSDDGTSNGILLWTMSNTSSLNTSSPSPSLDLTNIAVDTYAVPPLATQPAGNRHSHSASRIPSSSRTATPPSPVSPATTTRRSAPGNKYNDSRMQQVSYANGKVWGALDTALIVGGEERAGVAYYIINPHSAKLVLQGQAGLAHTDLTYPAIGVLENGRGVMTFTLTGDNNYPSAAYAGLDAKVGLSDIQIAAAGSGPWDGFTSYVIFGSGRPRWGDYGAAAVDGNSIWVASEYVAQTCNYATYIVDPTCGATRAPLGNWSTHISKLTP